MDFTELLLEDLLNYSGFYTMTYDIDNFNKIHRLYRTLLSNMCVYLTKQNTLSKKDIAHIYIDCYKFIDSLRDFEYVFNKILSFFRKRHYLKRKYYEIETNLCFYYDDMQLLFENDDNVFYHEGVKEDELDESLGFISLSLFP